MFTKFNYGWELWISNWKVAWVKSVKWSLNIGYIRLGHLEINTGAF